MYQGMGLVSLITAGAATGPLAPIAIFGGLVAESFGTMFAPTPDWALPDVPLPVELLTEANSESIPYAQYFDNGNLIFTATGGVYSNSMGVFPTWEKALAALEKLGIKLIAYYTQQKQIARVNYTRPSQMQASVSDSILPIAAIGLIAYMVMK